MTCYFAKVRLSQHPFPQGPVSLSICMRIFQTRFKSTYIRFVQVHNVVAHPSIISNLIYIIFPPRNKVGVGQHHSPVHRMISLIPVEMNCKQTAGNVIKLQK